MKFFKTVSLGAFVGVLALGCGGSPSVGSGGNGGAGGGIGGSASSSSSHMSTSHSSGTHATSSGMGGAGGQGGAGGGEGGSGGGQGGSGGGAEMHCKAATDCPDPGSECIDRTCDNNICGTKAKPKGTLLASQTPHDCKKDVCDGKGKETTQVDDTDLPDDGNDCTNDICTNGVASHTDVDLNTPCGTGGTLKCNATGSCVGCTAPTDCTTPTNTCLVATCSNAGSCGTANQTNGTSCDDGSACTQTDTCQAGVCKGGNPVNCTATDGCHTAGTCNPADGTCSNPQKMDGATCDDGNACTQTDTCQSGGCVGNSPVTCSAKDQCHDIGTCNTTTGKCSNPAKQDGSGCDDGNACTQTDTCVGGSCSGGNPVVCATPDQCHNAGTCDTTNGQCSNPAKGNGVHCDDGNACTQTDTCQGGACVGGNLVVCGASDQCHDVGTCDTGTGNCSNPKLGDGTPCDDGDKCTQTDTCQNGSCSGGNPVTCTALDDCHDMGTCDSGTGNCSTPNLIDGTTCTTGPDNGECFTGTCQPDPEIVAIVPNDGTVVAANTNISVTFTTPMDDLPTQTTAGSCSGAIQVSVDNFNTCIAFSAAKASLSGGGTVATLTPEPGLLVNTTYVVRVTTGATSAFGLALPAEFTQPTGFTTSSPNICDGSVIISQVYGAGGNAGSTYDQDFVELHNRGTSAVSVAGWSVQYAGPTGTTSWTPVALTGSIPAGGYYLVGFGSGANGGPLPPPDASGGTNMGAAAGKVALVSNSTALSGQCPTTAGIVDLVGYGTTANCFEGTAPTPAPSGTNSATRISTACADSKQNGLDFAAVAASPHNSASAKSSCACLVQNESNAVLEADYCDIQSPLFLSVQTGTSSGNVFGQVYELGTTEATGAAANVRAELGYGPANTNPEYEAGWTWVAASYNVQSGSNDEYKASFTAPAAGTYGYVYRFSLDSGLTWTVCDLDQGDDGAGSNPGETFELSQIGVLTVTP